jgi:hypothetical protein
MSQLINVVAVCAISASLLIIFAPQIKNIFTSKSKSKDDGSNRYLPTPSQAYLDAHPEVFVKNGVIWTNPPDHIRNGTPAPVWNDELHAWQDPLPVESQPVKPSGMII